MILAATFTGDGAEEQAQALVDEFRQRFRMTAYAHEMSFDYSPKKSPGRGVDEYGAPIRRRFQRGDRVREIAVLVGNYPSVDDPDAQEALEKIKTMQPNALQADGEQTSQSMAQVREWQDQLLERLGKKRDRGPMVAGVPDAQSAVAARVLRAQGRRRFCRQDEPRRRAQPARLPGAVHREGRHVPRQVDPADQRDRSGQVESEFGAGTRKSARIRWSKRPRTRIS